MASLNKMPPMEGDSVSITLGNVKKEYKIQERLDDQLVLFTPMDEGSEISLVWTNGRWIVVGDDRWQVHF